MKPILMEHPDHGQCHVYTTTEREYIAKSGWKKVDELPVAPEKAKADIVDISTVDLKAKYREVFGKTPHHLLNRKSLEKALHGVK